MAEVVRLPMGELPPQDGRWVLVSPDLNGLYDGRCHLGPGSATAADYAPTTTPDIDEAVSQALEWADANDVPVVYLQQSLT